MSENNTRVMFEFYCTDAVKHGYLTIEVANAMRELRNAETGKTESPVAETSRLCEAVDKLSHEKLTLALTFLLSSMCVSAAREAEFEALLPVASAPPAPPVTAAQPPLPPRRVRRAKKLGKR